MSEQLHAVVNTRTWEVVSLENRDPGTDNRIMFPGDTGQR